MFWRACALHDSAIQDHNDYTVTPLVVDEEEGGLQMGSLVGVEEAQKEELVASLHTDEVLRLGCSHSGTHRPCDECAGQGHSSAVQPCEMKIPDFERARGHVNTDVQRDSGAV